MHVVHAAARRYLIIVDAKNRRGRGRGLLREAKNISDKAGRARLGMWTWGLADEWPKAEARVAAWAVRLRISVGFWLLSARSADTDCASGGGCEGDGERGGSGVSGQCVGCAGDRGRASEGATRGLTGRLLRVCSTGQPGERTRQPRFRDRRADDQTTIIRWPGKQTLGASTTELTQHRLRAMRGACRRVREGGRAHSRRHTRRQERRSWRWRVCQDPRRVAAACATSGPRSPRNRRPAEHPMSRVPAHRAMWCWALLTK